jgi:Uma2 family endonuclease
MAFSRKNKPYRIEKNSRGEIEIMTPVGGKGGRRENFIGRELDFFAEEQGGLLSARTLAFTCRTAPSSRPPLPG